ncbi:unnamed protein product, partial [Symbiodinium sp. CCMP2456]
MPQKIVVDAGIPREPLLPFLKGHFWDQGQRYNLVSTGGPLRWPLRDGDGVQECKVWDPRGPPGSVRVLTAEEVWACQGRSNEAWQALRAAGASPATILAEGSRATGGQTAAALVLMAAYIADGGARAGAGYDVFDDENVNKLLSWLRRWKRGLTKGRTSDGLVVVIPGPVMFMREMIKGNGIFYTIRGYQKGSSNIRDDAPKSRGISYTTQRYQKGSTNTPDDVSQGDGIGYTIRSYHKGSTNIRNDFFQGDGILYTIQSYQKGSTNIRNDFSQGDGIFYTIQSYQKRSTNIRNDFFQGGGIFYTIQSYQKG